MICLLQVKPIENIGKRKGEYRNVKIMGCIKGIKEI